MIRRLRRRHRVASAALLAASLGGLALASLASPARTLEGELAREGAPRGLPSLEGATLVRLRSTGAVLRLDPEASTLELVSLEGELAPDLLVYWSATRAEGELPTDARLVGTLAGLREVPRQVPVDRGHLYLFSLGHGALVERFDLGG